MRDFSIGTGMCYGDPAPVTCNGSGLHEEITKIARTDTPDQIRTGVAGSKVLHD